MPKKLTQKEWIFVLMTQCEAETGTFYDSDEDDGFMRWLNKKTVAELELLLDKIQN